MAVTIKTFADVQNALDKFIGPPNDYPVAQAQHHVFWHKGNTQDEQYKYFVNGDAIPGFKILMKGNGPQSNIILALNGKPPFDGSTFPQMPEGGPPYLDQPTIDAICDWITAGANQFDVSGKDDAVTAKKEAAATVTIETFADVQNALDKFVGPPNNYPVAQAPHGVFWHNGSTQDEQYQYFVTQNAIPGFPILIKGNGPQSNIILALSGQSPFDGSTFPQMPVGGPPFLDQPTIDAICDWITKGAKQNG